MRYIKRVPVKAVFFFIKAIAASMVFIFFRLKIRGADNVPLTPPYIIASNHASFLDPVIIQVVIKHKIRWIAKKYIYENKYLGLIHRVFGSIPVNGSVKKALYALEKDCVLGVFPEGTRSRDGVIKSANPGVAIMALKSGVPVVPVGVRGSFEAFAPGRKFFKFYPIRVTVGRPIVFKKVEQDRIDDALLAEKKSLIMERIRELAIC